ncbi:MAG: elongation factor G [Prevotellaceae bacterium]|jgi:elongation factor G|nr:elongation factor G [Prevotellaceae bacterium]
MKVYQTSEVRNISLLGSSGSGKTTLVEAMLFESGAIKRKGTVDGKNTVSDYFPVEQEYGYSVLPTVVYAEWANKKLNLIDCPGSDDFIGGAITSLSVTDQAVLLVNAQYGVEVGTQNHFRNAEKLQKPVVFAVNYLDTDKTDFDRTLEQLKESFGSKVILIQYPLNAGTEFNAVIDVLKMKMYKWKAEGGAPEELDIPDSEKAKAEELHSTLIEAAAENDETLMEKFFEDGSLSQEDMFDGVHKGVVSCGMYPVLCVCAGRSMGVRRLMEFLGNVAASATEMKNPVTTNNVEVKPDVNAPTSLFVFKTSIEPHIGEVLYFKVLSGKINEGDDVTNVSRNDSKERISQLFCVQGQTRTKIEQVVAGDIGATVKLKDVRTGNTLNSKDCDWEYPEIKYPSSKYRRAIKAQNESEDEKLSEVLSKLHAEDPTWIVEQSKELRQTILYGQGEFHLRTLKWRVEKNDKIMIEFQEPRIPYRETITKAARADYRHKKQSGGAGQFGEVHMIIEPFIEGEPPKDIYKFGGQEHKVSVRDTQEIPLEWGGKLVFINSIVGGSIDTRFMPAILKGIMDRIEQGPLTGSYARDIRVIVYDGKMHPVDSNEISFRLAGRNAFAQAFKEAGPKLLEPIYDVDVFVPSDRMGDVMSDLQGRRGVVMGMHSERGFEHLKAKMPLKELSSYSTALSSLSGGRASFSMKFNAYELCPMDVQDKLIKEYEATRKEEE